jgi:hypothetical protein
MSVYDNIREQTDAAETEHNITLASLEQAQGRVEVLSQELTAERQKMTDHMKMVAPAGHPTEPDEPDPDPEPAQVFGTSYGGADESRNDGRSEVARIFFQGNCPSDPFADADWQQASRDGNTSVVFSWKGSQTGESLQTCFDSIPDGITVYGCYWHEPEDNIPGDMSLASWRGRHIEHQEAMREVGVIPVGIFMAYTLNDNSGRDITDYYCGDDGVMFDAYFNPAKGKTNPEAVVDKCVAAARAANAKFGGLGETGVPDSVDDQVTIQLTTRLRAKLDVTPYMRVNCYWPSGDFRFISDAHADAWFTDPTPAPLVATRNG